MSTADRYQRYLDHSAVKLLRAAAEGGPKPKPDAIFGAYVNVEQTVTPVPDICPEGVAFRLWSNVKLAVDKINRTFRSELEACRSARARDNSPAGGNQEPANAQPTEQPVKPLRQQKRKKKRGKNKKSMQRTADKPPSAAPQPTKRQGIVLVSRRGMRIDETRKCDECRMEEHPIWRCAESNIGPAFLCSRCKPKVFDRSFGTIDVMNTRLITVNAVESSRRRH